MIELDPAAIDLGRRLNRRAVDVFAKCTAEDDWPDYGQLVHSVSLPVLRSTNRKGFSTYDRYAQHRDRVRQSTRMGAFDDRDEGLIRYLGLNPSKPEDRAVVAVCRHYGFDPLLKHVVVIPRSGVYITRDGLLNVAHRSGQLDGIVVVQDPELDGDQWIAKVSVYRKDMSHPFTFPGRYPANGGNKQYAPEMALKAAEAHALRRAFDITGLPTLDEQQPTEAAQPAQSARVTTDEIVAPRKAKVKLADPQPEHPHQTLSVNITADEPDAEPADRSDEVAELFAADADAE